MKPNHQYMPLPKHIPLQSMLSSNQAKDQNLSTIQNQNKTHTGGKINKPKITQIRTKRNSNPEKEPQPRPFCHSLSLSLSLLRTRFPEANLNCDTGTPPPQPRLPPQPPPRPSRSTASTRRHLRPAPPRGRHDLKPTNHQTTQQRPSLEPDPWAMPGTTSRHCQAASHAAAATAAA